MISGTTARCFIFSPTTATGNFTSKICGGHFILATFAEDGPLKCSGLDVERYDLKKMIGTVGRGFELIESLREQHTTPSGKTQSFQFALFERR